MEEESARKIACFAYSAAKSRGQLLIISFKVNRNLPPFTLQVVVEQLWAVYDERNPAKKS